MTQGRDRIRIWMDFIGPSQRYALQSGTGGEEGAFFRELITKTLDRIEAMPKTYEQEHKGRDAIVYLHYFLHGADWYITEKDSDPPDNQGNRQGQIQAFGLADLYGDGGELGYISIKDIIRLGGELDLYWTPITLAEVQRKREKRLFDSDPADLPTAKCIRDGEWCANLVLHEMMATWKRIYELMRAWHPDLPHERVYQLAVEAQDNAIGIARYRVEMEAGREAVGPTLRKEPMEATSASARPRRNLEEYDRLYRDPGY